ncbi:OmpH family outer membrane protein [uncultured Microscilla sp.]|uniref:OmpH family outer membrane protein n=1 Tax=uncultured Microscilla sp. TaxID=432653 RepID=UPI002611B2B6|nr:OmpH family outer membrane protein [uncultured Microscilla sp.]
MKTLYITNLIILVGIIGYLAWKPSLTPTIAYVRSAYLVEKYLGVKEAQRNYQKKLASWQINADTLQHKLEATLKFYQTQQATLNEAQRKQLRVEVQRRRADLDRYQLNMQTKAKEEEDRLFGGALKQINSFVEQYAKSQGYEIVLGTTETGNLMYASHAYDITDEVLTALNKNYQQ